LSKSRQKLKKVAQIIHIIENLLQLLGLDWSGFSRSVQTSNDTIDANTIQSLQEKGPKNAVIQSRFGYYGNL